jgi:hypothetical protein
MEPSLEATLRTYLTAASRALANETPDISFTNVSVWYSLAASRGSLHSSRALEAPYTS